MSRMSLIVGLLLVVVGLVWVGQGLGYVGGSFMTGETRWTWIGAATAVVGAVLLLWSSFRRP